MSAFEYNWQKDQYHLQDQMIAWCLENIGPGNQRHSKFGAPDKPDVWYCWWAMGMGGFVFSTQEDLDKFTDQWKAVSRTGLKRSQLNRRSDR